MATRTIEDLLKENEELKAKIVQLEQSLQKYTNSDRHKRYYEKNKEKVKARAKEYMERMRTENPEKIKEWKGNAKKSNDL
jgi:cell division septum initiation protein DivIVA